MKILFDQETPVPLRKSLARHLIHTAHEMEWSRLENGDLLTAAEADGFELMITTDQNLRYQQKMRARRISIPVLTTTSWPKIQKRVAEIVVAVNATVPGD